MNESVADEDSQGDVHPYPFILFLILIGGVLVLAPEFVFLRDQFANRMNTIFKFYYQAWWLLSVAAAFGVAVLLQNLRGAWNWIYRVGLAVALFMALVYPVLGLLTKTENFQVPAFQQSLQLSRAGRGPTWPCRPRLQVWTLDGGAFFDKDRARRYGCCSLAAFSGVWGYR